MKSLELFKKVELPYFIGAIICLNFIIISIVSYNSYSFPLIFPIVSFCTYCGVLLRGRLNQKSWGDKPRQLKSSTLFGYFSFFVIVVIEVHYLLKKNFSLPLQQVKNLTIYLIVGLFILSLLLYLFWIRKLNYNNFNESSN